MIKYILLLWLLDGSGGGSAVPLAEFYEDGNCKFAAHQLSTHPQNRGLAEFTCLKQTDL